MLAIRHSEDQHSRRPCRHSLLGAHEGMVSTRGGNAVLAIPKTQSTFQYAFASQMSVFFYRTDRMPFPDGCHQPSAKLNLVGLYS
jgi:hypothetical protein